MITSHSRLATSLTAMAFISILCGALLWSDSAVARGKWVSFKDVTTLSDIEDISVTLTSPPDAFGLTKTKTNKYHWDIISTPISNGQWSPPIPVPYNFVTGVDYVVTSFQWSKLVNNVDTPIGPVYQDIPGFNVKELLFETGQYISVFDTFASR